MLQNCYKTVTKLIKYQMVSLQLIDNVVKMS